MMHLKALLRSLSLVALMSAAAPAAPLFAATIDESVIPVEFQGDTPGSQLHINYKDLSEMLEQTVLVTGMSERETSNRIVPNAGSRIVRGPSGGARLEGNRVDFHAFLGDNYKVLVGLRKSLEAVPSQVPLSELSRDDQLAYWLNLYNVTMLSQIAEIFPATNLRRYHEGADNLWDEKVLNVAGVPLSLNDINHKILIPKYKNPLIMYGLFQGVIGGPNLRAEAYEGHRVYSQLQANAREFINSNRGAKMRDRLLRVSYLYEDNAALFPDWSNDVREHLMDYAKPEFQEKIAGASSAVGATIDNWYIADLFGGNRSITVQNTGSASLLGAIKTGGGVGAAADYGGGAGGGIESSWVANLSSQNPYMTRFPMHMIQHLKDIREKNARLRKGEVGIEEYGDDPLARNPNEQAEKSDETGDDTGGDTGGTNQ